MSSPRIRISCPKRTGSGTTETPPPTHKKSKTPTTVSQEGGKHPEEDMQEEAALVPASPATNHAADGTVTMSTHHKAVSSILSLVRSVPNPVEYLKNGGLAFLNTAAAETPSVMKHIDQEGGIALLLKYLKDYPHEQDIQDQGHSLLGLFCEQVKAMPDKIGIERILDMMDWLEDDAILQEMCCKVLWSVSKVDDLRTFIVELHGIQQVVSTLEKHSDFSELHLSNCLGTLANSMFRSEDAKEQLASAGGIDVVMNSLKPTEVGKGTMMMHSQHAIAVLQNFSYNSNQRSNELVDKGVHTLIANCLFQQEQNHLAAWSEQEEAILEGGCWLLYHLVAFTSPLKKEMVMKAVFATGNPDVILAIGRGMERSLDAEQLQLATCSVLFELSKAGPEVRGAIIQANALQPIVATIRRYNDENEVVATCAKKANRQILSD